MRKRSSELLIHSVGMGGKEGKEISDASSSIPLQKKTGSRMDRPGKAKSAGGGASVGGSDSVMHSVHSSLLRSMSMRRWPTSRWRHVKLEERRLAERFTWVHHDLNGSPETSDEKYG